MCLTSSSSFTSLCDSSPENMSSSTEGFTPPIRLTNGLPGRFLSSVLFEPKFTNFRNFSTLPSSLASNFFKCVIRPCCSSLDKSLKFCSYVCKSESDKLSRFEAIVFTKRFRRLVISKWIRYVESSIESDTMLTVVIGRVYCVEL